MRNTLKKHMIFKLNVTLCTSHCQKIPIFFSYHYQYHVIYNYKNSIYKYSSVYMDAN